MQVSWHSGQLYVSALACAADHVIKHDHLASLACWVVAGAAAPVERLPAYAPCHICTAVAGVDESASREAIGEMQRAGAILMRGTELLEQSRAGGAAAEGSSKVAAAAGAARQHQIAAGKEE